MLGTSDTKDLLVFVARLGNSIDKTLSDGKVTLTDAGYLFDPLFSAKAAFEGLANIDDELADLDSEEATNLVSIFADELELSNDEAEDLSEEGIALAISIVNFVNKIRAARG